MVAAAVATVVCLALVAGHGTTWTLPGLDALERTSIDARFRVRGPRALRDDRIVIVGLDDEARRRHPELTQTRRGYARLLDALGKHEPAVIGLDLFFSTPERLLPDALATRVREAHA